MAMSNAQRQARWRSKLKTRAAAADTAIARAEAAEKALQANPLAELEDETWCRELEAALAEWPGCETLSEPSRPRSRRARAR